MDSKTDIQRIKEIPITRICQQLGISYDRSLKALCFKGHDTHPSLSINAQNNFFKCFGCGIGGTTIDLVKEYFNSSTGEAIQWLKRNYSADMLHGTPTSGQSNKDGIDKFVSQVQQNQTNKKEGKSGSKYSQIYQKVMELSEIEPAVQYLGSRGISRKITEQAGIRVAPKGIKQKLIDVFGKAQLKEAGVIATNKNGHDYFVFCHNRLLIPFYDQDGSTILNIQGRNIDDMQEPKYRFLPKIETVPYNLQALVTAETIFLCEGAIDALSCYQLGLLHPLGIAGVNSFKEKYFSLLQPYQIIVAGDVDNRGRSFYLKLRREFLKRGKNIKELEYTKLKANYNISSDTKDLNEIAQLADYDYFTKHLPKKHFSHVVNDYYTEKEEGVLFDSGVFYSKKEIAKIKDHNEDMLQAIHNIKTVFGGDIL